MDTARVEPAKPARDVQPLHGPMAVDDAVPMVSFGPALVPRAAPGVRLGRRPIITGPNAATAHEATENVSEGRGPTLCQEFSRSLGCPAELRLHRASLLRDFGKGPGWMHRRVHHDEWRRTELSLMYDRPAAQPIHPLCRVCVAQEGMGRIQWPGLTKAMVDFEKADLVVAEHRFAATRIDEAAGKFQDLAVAGTAVDEVAHQVQRELVAERHFGAAHEFGELVPTALDVSDEDRLHATGIGGGRAGC